MMYWFRKQGAFWRDYIDAHPFRMLGLIGFVLIGGVILGDITGTALRPLVNPSASATPTPVFTPSPSIKPMRKPVRTHPAAPQPTYRPEPRPTIPHPTRTRHTPSPTPTKTKTHKPPPPHGPCWPKLTCPPSDSISPTPAPGER